MMNNDYPVVDEALIEQLEESFVSLTQGDQAVIRRTLLAMLVSSFEQLQQELTRMGEDLYDSLQACYELGTQQMEFLQEFQTLLQHALKRLQELLAQKAGA